MTLLVIATQMLGLGANTAVFSVVNAVILRPLPLYQPDRIVKIYTKINNAPNFGISYPEYLDWRAQTTSFDALGVYRSLSFNLTGLATPQHVQAFAVGPSYFKALGVSTILGRQFTDSDDQAAAERVVILSCRLWQQTFGGDANILGRSLILDDHPYIVIGVLEDNPVPLVQRADVWVPNAPFLDATMMNRLSRFYWPAARLKPNVTQAQATAELEMIAARLAAQYPASNNDTGIRVVSLNDLSTGEGRRPVLFLLLASTVIFLLACTNVLMVFMSNTWEHKREIAIRLALGTPRSCILRQFFVQAALFAGIGSGLAFLLAQLGVKALVRLFPTAIVRFQETSIDWKVILFLATLTFLTILVASVLQALYCTRLNITRALKDDLGPLRSSPARFLGRNLLIVCEISLACALSVVAGLLIKSFYEVSKVDLGFNPHQIISFQINLPASRYKNDEALILFHKQALDKLSSIHGVVKISGLSSLPLTGLANTIGLEVDENATTAKNHPIVEFECVFPGLFQTLKLPLLEGRDFAESDRTDHPRVVIVDEKLAAAYWPGQSPLGKRLRLPEASDPTPVWRQVIGVVRQTKRFGPELNVKWMQVYLSQYQDPTAVVNYVMESTLPLPAIKSDVETAIHQLDKDLPLDKFQAMDSLLDAYTASRRVSFLLLATFAGIGLILGTIGIYGMVSNSVVQRRRELAIRLALGSSRQQACFLITKATAASTLLGVTLGFFAIVALKRVLTAFLFGVTPLAPAVYLWSLGAIIGLAALACVIPVRATLRLNPQEILKE